MSSLFEEENSESEEELKINSDYAKNYDAWRQKEELNKLKTKYGEIGVESSDESDSESSSEDEEDETELKEQFDKDFYKTLACLKSKDPRIYDEGVTFFEGTNDVQKSKEKQQNDKSKKEKALYLRDYERKIMLERDGKYSDSEDEEIAKQKKEAVKKKTYVQEQEELKDSLKRALKDEEEEQEEETELLKPKTKSESEKEKEEAAYKEWLKGQQLEINEKEKQELQPLRDFWNNPNLDANEKFLRDYILNNKFLDKNNPDEDLDYEQIIHDSDENLSEDEKNIEKQEEFEYKYNYRFEEPDQEFIKRYPRTMENSLRKKDTRRAQKRAEVKQRKEEEKVRKMEELKQLKALKRKEIEEKIEKLKEITGNDDIKFNEIDLDGDFDPNEHDKKMTEIFNEEFYNAPEDDVKPEFPDIDEELEIEQTWDAYDPNLEDPGNENYEEGPHCEDEDFNMDADYDPTRAKQEELIEGTKKRKRKRKSKFAELLSKEKPKFDPKQFPSYQEYFDKYYSLDYEDMIGDIPCRFKYRKVVPNDYGLSVEEILMADDKELNKWCSLKRALQYKSEHVELNDVKTYKHKAANEALKRKILKSLYKDPNEEETEEPQEKSEEPATVNGVGEPKKKRRRKKKSQEPSTESNPNPELSTIPEEPKKEEPPEKTKADKRKLESSTEETPSKKQKKESTSNVEEEKKKKKKKKKKQQAPVSTPPPNKKTLKSKKQKLNVKKQQGMNGIEADIARINPERLKTYGLNPRKLKNKLKYGKKKQQQQQ